MENNKKKHIVAIVDGMGIGRYYSPEFKKHGYSCVNIQSSVVIPDAYKSSFLLNSYIDNLIFTENNLEEIVAKLQQYNVEYVIPGSEPGVELADLISYKMHLPTTNLIDDSEARRNKFKMIEALKAHGLQTAEHVKSSKAKDIIKWAKKLNNWPIVLKPIKSAFTEGVYFCSNEAEIESRFNSIKNSINVYGDKNKEILAESYLDGEQYLVNVVSFNKQHMLSDLWICKKQSMGEYSLPIRLSHNFKFVVYF